VRAWCEKNLAYRDFVLSRFRGEAELLDASEHDEAGDRDWQQIVDVVVAPDPRLSSAQRDVIAQDYAMQSGRLTLQTRATLVSYLLRLLQLDPEHEQENPLAQQIVLENREQLKPWLFP
jgi:predicted DNA-binding transcriptional regulator YafY